MSLPDGFAIPIARKMPRATGIPYSLRGQVHAFDHMQAVQEIGRTFGRSTKPQKPILIHGPYDKQVIVIAGMGEAEAAEIEDVAIAKLEQAEERHARGLPAFDFGERRENHGLPAAKDFDTNFRIAMEENIKRRKRNSRTEAGPHEKKVF